jgi:hypothetical protein
MEAFIGHPVWRMDPWGSWNITAEQEEAWNDFLERYNIKKF